jgi:PHD and RING finger domain-containing protein 1
VNRSSSSTVAACPPLKSAAAVQKVDVSDGRSHDLEPAGHADDEHGNADGSEVDVIRDEDSVKCPVCSATFATQEVGTPDTCDHTFCAACLQEWPKNEKSCPVDQQMFDFILLRHHLGGEIITITPVEPPKGQSVCNREGGKSLWCHTLGHGLRAVIMMAYTLGLCFAIYVLTAYSLRQSSMQ